MARKAATLTALTVVSVTGILIFAVMNSNKSTPSNTSKVSQQPESETDNLPEASVPAENTGTYTDLSENAIAEAKGDIYLFFHAPWCSQCRSIEAGIKSDGVPANVTIIKVDYDSNQALRQHYGVTLQTTFVKIENSGELVSKFVAYQDPMFSSVVRDYIKQ